MNIPTVDLSRLVRLLRAHWQRLTRGTTRAAGVAMCLTLLCAVVVGGSQVMPFVSVQDPTATTADVENETSTAGDASTRELTHTDYNESWRQAGTNWDRLGDVDRRHQVLIDSSGRLTGHLTTFADWHGDVMPLAGAAVHLMQNGRVAAETTTDAEGRFVADGLSDGTYSLIAESPAGLLAYALHLRQAASDESVSELQLDSMATTQWDTAAILERVLEYWHSEPPIDRTREPESNDIPESVRPIPQSGASATTVLNHQVRLQSDGRLIGRLRRLHPVTGRSIVATEIEVALYRNGTLQGLTWTDDIGCFEISHVAPGVYSLVATGAPVSDPAARLIPGEQHGLRQGLLALGIQVLPANDAIIRPVSSSTATGLEIDAALVDLADLQPFLGPPGSKSTAQQAGSLSLNGANSGTAGGGGVGGSNLGAWLAAGAAAGLTALLVDGLISESRP